MLCLLDETDNENSNGNNININKTCCIVDSAPCVHIPSLKPFLTYEIQMLISEGYTNFITYYRPSINHCVIEILSELSQSLENPVSIELVLISHAYLHRLYPSEQKDFNRLAGLCSKVGYIDVRQIPRTMSTFCNYLANRCNLLYSVGDEFRFIYGRKNKRIVQAFQTHGRIIRIVKTRDMRTNYYEQ